MEEVAYNLDLNMVLIGVLAGISILLFLILYFKIQAFLSLLIASIAVGLISGIPVNYIIDIMKTGMGDTLGFVATVVGLGALFGAILEQSGGAKVIASFLLEKFGEKRASWALMLTGFIIAIPVFFDVAFIILIPLLYSLQKKTGKSLLLYGIPLLAGLTVTHNFIPPTPGPIAVSDILGADLGWVILLGSMVGIPAAIIGGPLFGKFISKKIYVHVPDFFEKEPDKTNSPSVGLIGIIILTPILLIVLNTVSNSSLGENLALSNSVKSILAFIGDPFTALIIANLLAWFFLGIRKGFTKSQLLKITSDSLAPAGIIILLTGAGGVFKQMLISTGAGEMLAANMSGSLSSPVIFAFIVTAIIRVIQGSSTVAMITSAGMTASLTASIPMSPFQNALLVVAIASGAIIFSHVNDSGFWLVNRYFGITEKQTFSSWTAMTVIISLVSFALILFLYNLTI